MSPRAAIRTLSLSLSLSLSPERDSRLWCECNYRAIEGGAGHSGGKGCQATAYRRSRAAGHGQRRSAGWDSRAHRDGFSQRIKVYRSNPGSTRGQHHLQFHRRYSQLELARWSDASARSERSGWSKDQFVGRDCCDHRYHCDGGDTRVNEEEQELLLQVYRVGRNRAALFTRTPWGVDPGESRANDHHAGGLENDPRAITDGVPNLSGVGAGVGVI